MKNKEETSRKSQISTGRKSYGFWIWILVFPVCAMVLDPGRFSGQEKSNTAAMADATGFPLIFAVLLVIILLCTAYFTGRRARASGMHMLAVLCGVAFTFTAYFVVGSKRPSDEFARYHPRGTSRSFVHPANYTGNYIRRIEVAQMMESDAKNVSMFFGISAYSTKSDKACCINLPDKWQSGMSLRIKWDVQHLSRPWKEINMLSDEERVKYETWVHHEADVLIPEYKETATIKLAFLPGDKAEIWVTEQAFGPEIPSKRDNPRNPDAETVK